MVVLLDGIQGTSRSFPDGEGRVTSAVPHSVPERPPFSAGRRNVCILRTAKVVIINLKSIFHLHLLRLPPPLRYLLLFCVNFQNLPRRYHHLLSLTVSVSLIGAAP